jgi:hypothetical protein
MTGGTVKKAKIPVTKNAHTTGQKIIAQQVTTLPISWVGIDKINMPPSQADHGTGWLGGLIDNSNLRFTGAYVTGAVLPIADYTSSSRASNRHWVANIGSLRDQGWGIAFWYVGYSVGGGEKAPAGLAAIAAARGKLHAIHAKTIIHTTNPNLAGSVVFLDNEDNESVTVTQLDEIRDYYDAFFKELETETPGPIPLPAMRCGLYAHGLIATTFVRDRVDLFVWDVRRDTGNDAEPTQPFADNINPLFVDPAWKSSNPKPKGQGEREMHSFEVPSSRTNITDKWIAWPLGRQFRRYTGATPTVGWQVASGVQILNPVHEEFDYNSSLVRDPSYPVAEPRIAAATDNIVVAGTFEARTANMTSNSPRMKIETMDAGSGRHNVTGPVGHLIEPDAPIAVAAVSGAPTQFMTVLTTGDLAAFSRDPSGVLSPLDAIALAPASGLRRLRAIALVAYDANNLHLFFAGQDHQLYTSHRPSSGDWDITSLAGSLQALHPFSSLAAASRAQQSVDVFALDDQGLLSASSWSPTPGTWQRVQLDTATLSLLKAGALAATSPDPQKLFVFGVRIDLRLGYWEWTGPANIWSAPIAIGEPAARLSPHSRLAAHSYSGVVEVVGLSHDGILRLYSLKLTGTTWTAQSPVLYANPDGAPPEGYVPPPPSSPTEPAYGWNINPYGDLTIVRETNGTVAYAAGIAPGKSGLLSLNLTIGGSTWQLLR